MEALLAGWVGESAEQAAVHAESMVLSLRAPCKFSLSSLNLGLPPALVLRGVTVATDLLVVYGQVFFFRWQMRSSCQSVNYSSPGYPGRPCLLSRVVRSLAVFHFTCKRATRPAR